MYTTQMFIKTTNVVLLISLGQKKSHKEIAACVMERKCERTMWGSKTKFKVSWIWKLNFRKTSFNHKPHRGGKHNGVHSKAEYRIKDLNWRAKTIKFLDKNPGINLHDPRLGNGFFNIPKAQVTTTTK